MESIEIVLAEALEYGRNYINEGNVATYIPELAKVDKNLLGATIMTKDGEVFTLGDWDYEFTIQSISKVISLIFAISNISYDLVFEKVGMEASGAPFNSILELETKGYPSNPFINSGAIAIAGLIAEKYDFDYFLEYVRMLLNKESIEIDEDVYFSEEKTGMLNRSIGYFLKSNEIIKGNVEEVLDFYFKMCSIKVNTYDLSYFSLLLANNGIDSKTNKIIINEDIVKIVKSLMVICGMYDGSGEFAIRVGMPAKSGVGGGIIASSDNKLGISVFGPSLDERGNSIGGYHLLEYLSKKLDLHYF